jgi:hypothetical protein
MEPPRGQLDRTVSICSTEMLRSLDLSAPVAPVAPLPPPMAPDLGQQNSLANLDDLEQELMAEGADALLMPAEKLTHRPAHPPTLPGSPGPAATVAPPRTPPGLHRDRAPGPSPRRSRRLSIYGGLVMQEPGESYESSEPRNVNFAQEIDVENQTQPSAKAGPGSPIPGGPSPPAENQPLQREKPAPPRKKDTDRMLTSADHDRAIALLGHVEIRAPQAGGQGGF